MVAAHPPVSFRRDRIESVLRLSAGRRQPWASRQEKRRGKLAGIGRVFYGLVHFAHTTIKSLILNDREATLPLAGSRIHRPLERKGLNCVRFTKPVKSSTLVDPLRLPAFIL